MIDCKIRPNPLAAKFNTIIAIITLKPTIPILKFSRSNKLKYGSQILAIKRPNVESYAPGNHDNNA